MKHAAIWGLLAMALACTITTQKAWAWASGEGLELLRMPGKFLLHNSHGYLGVDLKNIDSDRASALKLPDTHGVEIITVDHDAPAGKAGLRVHDVILQMDGQPIDDVDQLRRMLHKMSPGRTVAFVVSRDGAAMNISLQLADRALLAQQAWSQHFSVPEPDEPASPPASGESFLSSSASRGSRLLGTLLPSSLYVGADVNPVRAQLADYFGVKSGTGLLVENVDSQSPAAQAGLKAGDVILKVNSRQMVTRNDWIKTIRANRGKQVQLTIVRNKQEQTLTMTAGAPRTKGEIAPPPLQPQQLRAEIGSMQ